MHFAELGRDVLQCVAEVRRRGDRQFLRRARRRRLRGGGLIRRAGARRGRALLAAYEGEDADQDDAEGPVVRKRSQCSSPSLSCPSSLVLRATEPGWSDDKWQGTSDKGLSPKR